MKTQRNQKRKVTARYYKYTLKIDIDINYDIFCQEFRPLYEKIVKLIADFLGVAIESMTFLPSSSNNTHVYIRILSDKRLEPREITKLQFFMYDDSKRVSFNWVRATKYPNLFNLMNTLFISYSYTDESTDKVSDRDSDKCRDLDPAL